MRGVDQQHRALLLRRRGDPVHVERAADIRMALALKPTGAGDAFYAGVLFGLHEDWPLARCLDLGNAAAATSLHSPTTSAGIRPWADCLDYAKTKGLRAV